MAQFQRSRPAPPFTIEDVTLRTGLVDYYKMFNSKVNQCVTTIHHQNLVMQLEKTANLMEIKAAYRQMQKKCHPDILGDEYGHDMSILLNDAYTVLSNELTRELYDIDLHGSRLEEELGFTNEAFSVWLPEKDPARARNANPAETRALFVDEATCIGCKQCCWGSKDTFVLDAAYGRARVQNQWADTEENLNLSAGVWEGKAFHSLENPMHAEMCPVRCIHWVEREELPVLEHIMRHTNRINIGVRHVTTAGKGTQTDVFVMAERFKAKKRERRQARKSWTEKFMYTRAQEEAMRRAANPNTGGSVFGGFNGFHFVMPWLRARIWDIFGYGLDPQPAVERKPRAWKPSTDSEYKGGSITGDVEGALASSSASTSPPEDTASSPQASSKATGPVDCARAHVLTPEEKDKIMHATGDNVPESEGSENVEGKVPKAPLESGM